MRRRIFGGFRKFESWGQYNEFMQKAYKILGAVEKLLPGRKQINILDIGCNKGFFLAACAEKGWDTHGVELVDELLTPFRRKYPESNILNGRFEDVHHKLNKNYFDVITAIDVVEHFEDPFESIKNIRQLLKPDGIFITQTPDSLSPQAKSQNLNWGALKDMEHLFIFNKNNYTSIVRQAGFNRTEFIPVFDEADGNFAAVSSSE
ncbi:MAG: class I SAM-dependent methyltransferase [Pseudomonadota bacterium]